MSQVLVNALVSAAGYLLVGLGFSLIYTTTRFFHFAHGMVLTVGAYTAFLLKAGGGLPFSLSVFGGILTSTLIGVGMEWSIYGPLRKRGASTTVLLLASLGIYVVLQSVVSLAFGSGTQTFRSGEVSEGQLLLGARLTAPQTAIILASVACCLLTRFLLQRTQIGKMLRAVASDSDLAELYGLDRDRVITVAFLIGSALGGVAGVLLASDADMAPTMGFRMLLMGMVAMIIGGVGSVPGIAAGALMIALAQHLMAWWISSQWQDALVFAILILFLLFRPQGFFGKPLWKAAV